MVPERTQEYSIKIVTAFLILLNSLLFAARMFHVRRRCTSCQSIGITTYYSLRAKKTRILQCFLCALETRLYNINGFSIRIPFHLGFKVHSYIRIKSIGSREPPDRLDLSTFEREMLFYRCNCTLIKTTIFMTL